MSLLLEMMKKQVPYHRSMSIYGSETRYSSYIGDVVLLYMCIVNKDKFFLIQFIRSTKYSIKIRIKCAKFRTLEPMAEI